MKNKKAGFTLVEIMACLAIASILTMTAASMLVFGNRTAIHYADGADDREIGEAIAGLVKRQLEYAQYLRIDSEENDGLPGEKSLCFSRDGRIYADGRDLYGDYYYGKCSINCRIAMHDESRQILQMEIYIEDEHGKTRYRGRTGLDFYNMKLTDGQIIYEASMMSDGVIDSGNQDIYLYYIQNHVEEGQGEINE